MVTGGAGFIGNFCIEKLLLRGDTVICVDNFNNDYSPDQKLSNIKRFIEQKKFYLYNLDITDQNAMIRIFATHKIDKILHLAARAGVRTSLQQPVWFVRDNLGGTAVLLELARQSGIKHFVMASSSSVYGGRTKIPFSETDPVDEPFSPYAMTKRACELMAYNYNHICGMKIACLRYFTVYGPRNRPEMAIYQFAQRIYNNQLVEIYGENTQRDWTYVDDIVEGTLKVLDNINTIEFETYNIGGGIPIQVSYLVELLQKELGKKALTRQVPLPMGDVPITCADTKKFEDKFGYKPTTSIEEGVKKFVIWFVEHQKHHLLDGQQQDNL